MQCSKNYFDENVIMFWHLLKPTILKNQVITGLDASFYNENKYNPLNEILTKYDLKVDNLNVTKTNLDVINFIQQRDDCGLKHLKARNVKVLSDKVSFKSITSIEICGNLNDIKDFLGFDVIAKKKLFVIVDKEINHKYFSTNINNKDDFLPLFNQLCENICQLMAQKLQ